MASKSPKAFDRKLNALLKTRMQWVKSEIWPNRGKKSKITVPKINKVVCDIQDLAIDAFLRRKDIKEILENYEFKKQWHPKRGKPFRIDAKQKAFKQWYDKHITTRNCVYIFWKNSRCLYVGRTISGHQRPTQHFSKSWFGGVTRIDIYGFSRKRDVPRFECLRTHLHDPIKSRITPSQKKYYTRCPICDVTEDIRDEIKYVFRLK